MSTDSILCVCMYSMCILSLYCTCIFCVHIVTVYSVYILSIFTVYSKYSLCMVLISGQDSITRTCTYKHKITLLAPG